MAMVSYQHFEKAEFEISLGLPFLDIPEMALGTLQLETVNALSTARVPRDRRSAAPEAWILLTRASAPPRAAPEFSLAEHCQPHQSTGRGNHP